MLMNFSSTLRFLLGMHVAKAAQILEEEAKPPAAGGDTAGGPTPAAPKVQIHCYFSSSKTSVRAPKTPKKRSTLN